MSAHVREKSVVSLFILMPHPTHPAPYYLTPNHAPTPIISHPTIPPPLSPLSRLRFPPLGPLALIWESLTYPKGQRSRPVTVLKIRTMNPCRCPQYKFPLL